MYQCKECSWWRYWHLASTHGEHSGDCPSRPEYLNWNIVMKHWYEYLDIICTQNLLIFRPGHHSSSWQYFYQNYLLWKYFKSSPWLIRLELENSGYHWNDLWNFKMFLIMNPVPPISFGNGFLLNYLNTHGSKSLLNIGLSYKSPENRLQLDLKNIYLASFESKR